MTRVTFNVGRSGAFVFACRNKQINSIVQNDAERIPDVVRGKVSIMSVHRTDAKHSENAV